MRAGLWAVVFQPACQPVAGGASRFFSLFLFRVFFTCVFASLSPGPDAR